MFVCVFIHIYTYNGGPHTFHKSTKKKKALECKKKKKKGFSPCNKQTKKEVSK